MRQISLRQRALEALSRREHSQWELRRKLSRHACEADDVEAVLDSLQKEGLLSDKRFAESLAHRRAERFGVRRIELEFELHHLSDELIASQIQVLAGNEAERCQAVWQKKFNHPPIDFADRSRQSRFLAARGFSVDAIKQVLGAFHDPDSMA